MVRQPAPGIIRDPGVSPDGGIPPVTGPIRRPARVVDGRDPAVPIIGHEHPAAIQVQIGRPCVHRARDVAIALAGRRIPAVPPIAPIVEIVETVAPPHDELIGEAVHHDSLVSPEFLVELVVDKTRLAGPDDQLHRAVVPGVDPVQSLRPEYDIAGCGQKDVIRRIRGPGDHLAPHQLDDNPVFLKFLEHELAELVHPQERSVIDLDLDQSVLVQYQPVTDLDRQVDVHGGPAGTPPLLQAHVAVHVADPGDVVDRVASQAKRNQHPHQERDVKFSLCHFAPPLTKFSIIWIRGGGAKFKKVVNFLPGGCPPQRPHDRPLPPGGGRGRASATGGRPTRRQPVRGAPR